MAGVNKAGASQQDKGTVVAVSEDATIAATAVAMRRHRIGSVVVVDRDGCMTGILTERDILSKVVAESLHPAKVKAAEIMTRPVVSCGPDTPLSEVQKRMAAHGIRHLPIVQGARAVGMVSSRDILARELDEVKALLKRQGRVLSDLEQAYPGITRIHRDPVGRIIIPNSGPVDPCPAPRQRN